jgi:hypothetical protein
MKKIIVAIAILCLGSTMYAQSEQNEIGWRKDFIISYCDEYDIMIDGNKGQWVIPWTATREVVKYTLKRDGFKFTETDSTISWESGKILQYEIQFKSNEEVQRIGTIITIPVSSGPKIAESLKKKLEMIYKIPGKYLPSEGSGLSYTWIDKDCSTPTISMLSRTIVNSETYLITIFSTKLSK